MPTSGKLQGFAGRLRRPPDQTEVNSDGQENERDIYFMKGYTVFNVEQIEASAAFLRRAAPQLDPVQRIDAATSSSPTPGRHRHGGNQAYYAATPDYVQMPPFVSSRTPRAITQRWP